MASELSSAALPARALEAEDVSKSFAGNRALAHVDLRVDMGEVRCLVGGNGSGKSTFIKILSGYHQPDPGGEIRIGGEVLRTGHPKDGHRLGARFVHQDLGLILDATITDNLFLGGQFPIRFGAVNGRTARRQSREALERVGLELDPDTLVRDLSPAQRTGVAITRAVATGWDSVRLLVLDEPTATLPATEVRALLARVRAVSEAGVGVLYVTHRLDEVFQIGHTVTVLRNGREIGTEPVDAVTRQVLLERIVGEEVAEVQQESTPAAATASPVLTVSNVSAGRLRDATFSVAPGEIVGVSGVTGSGREELNGVLFGALRREQGSVSVDGREVPSYRPAKAIDAGLAFLSAERRTHSGFMTLSATENLTITALDDFWAAPRLRTRAEHIEAERWFERLSVQPAGAMREQLVTFSGGNQQKVLLAKWLRLKPRVLLLDEPTQGVDAAATAEIYRQILASAENGAAVVVASSDIDELVALCARVLVIERGVIVKELRGAELNVRSVTSWSLGATRDKAVQA